MQFTTTPGLEGYIITEYCGAVSGMDIDYDTVGKDGSMPRVCVSGTAVKTRK